MVSRSQAPLVSPAFGAQHFMRASDVAPPPPAPPPDPAPPPPPEPESLGTPPAAAHPPLQGLPPAAAAPPGPPPAPAPDAGAPAPDPPAHVEAPPPAPAQPVGVGEAAGTPHALAAQTDQVRSQGGGALPLEGTGLGGGPLGEGGAD